MDYDRDSKQREPEMARKNWAKVADEQFANLPKDFQKDWLELRDRLYKK